MGCLSTLSVSQLVSLVLIVRKLSSGQGQRGPNSEFRTLFDLSLTLVWPDRVVLHINGKVPPRRIRCCWSGLDRTNRAGVIWFLMFFYTSATCRLKLDDVTLFGSQLPFFWYQAFDSTTINKRGNGGSSFRRLTLYWPWPWAEVSPKLMVAIPSADDYFHKVSSLWPYVKFCGLQREKYEKNNKKNIGVNFDLWRAFSLKVKLQK